MIEKQQQNQARDVFCHVLPRADDRLWRANVATPTLLCSRMRAATIRGRLLFLWWTSRCGYYSRAATIRGAASIRINTVDQITKRGSLGKSCCREVPYPI